MDSPESPDRGALAADVVIRPMRPSDLPEVMHIERRSFATPWEESTFRGLMRRPMATLFVGESEGRVAGYGVLWFAAAEAELGNLAVLPELRRRGLGRRLLEHAFAETRERGSRGLYLEVRASNVAARRMYERAGFSLARIRRNYYSSPVEDALLLRCDL